MDAYVGEGFIIEHLGIVVGIGGSVKVIVKNWSRISLLPPDYMYVYISPSP
jgi:hypothetical protein